MSTEQPFDPQLIEQTKQQIQKLVREIAQLTKDQVSPGEFYGEFLPRVVQALAAIGGAIWSTDENGRLALQYQVNLEATKLRENEEGQAQHGRLLYKCLNGEGGILVPPHSGVSEDDDEAVNPTDYLLVLGPLKADQDTVGVLEIIQRAEAGPATQQGYLRFAMQMCELAGDYLKSHKLRDFGGREALWTSFSQSLRKRGRSGPARSSASGTGGRPSRVPSRGWTTRRGAGARATLPSSSRASPTRTSIRRCSGPPGWRPGRPMSWARLAGAV